MRILMLAHRIPYPPHTGDKLRAFQVARFLARHHDLTLGFIVDDPADRAGVAELRRLIGDVEPGMVWKPAGVARGLAALCAGGCLTLQYFRSGDLLRRIAERHRARPYDLVYVSSSPMAQYAAALPGVPAVLDLVDVDSDKWLQYAARTSRPRSWLYRMEGMRLRRFEGAIARWGRPTVLATRAEEALLRSFAPWAVTAVVPNGVALDEYVPAPEPAPAPTVMFTGAMDYFPNVDAVQYFCEEIFPTVVREVPEARFLIVGLNPTAAVRRLGARPGVTVTGAVPDVRPYYHESSVAVAPLRIARGVQNKVLQAMAMGLPVVATTAATQGIDARPDEHLLVADDASSFAARLVGLLENPKARRALGARARAFVEASHSWDACLGQLHQLLLAQVNPCLVQPSSP